MSAPDTCLACGGPLEREGLDQANSERMLFCRRSDGGRDCKAQFWAYFQAQGKRRAASWKARHLAEPGGFPLFPNLVESTEAAAEAVSGPAPARRPRKPALWRPRRRRARAVEVGREAVDLAEQLRREGDTVQTVVLRALRSLREAVDGPQAPDPDRQPYWDQVQPAARPGGSQEPEGGR